MRKFLLMSGVAISAMALAAPSFAQKAATGGDDYATITQVGESNGLATQHQPGLSANFAKINQTNGSGDVATQEQWRGHTPVDFALGGSQTITQTNNYMAKAAQTDNSILGKQTSTQTGNWNVSSTQTINSPFGRNNTQSSTQRNSGNSSVSQVIGQEADFLATASNNSQ